VNNTNLHHISHGFPVISQLHRSLQAERG